MLFIFPEVLNTGGNRFGGVEEVAIKKWILGMPIFPSIWHPKENGPGPPESMGLQ